MIVGGVGTTFADTTYKLTQVSSVEVGGLYVFEQSGHVMNNSVSSSALQTTATYKTTGLSGTETYVWTLETANNGFYLRNVSLNSNQYLNNTSSTSISFGNKNSIWTFDFADGIALICNSSNSNRFLGFTTSTSYAYKAYAISNLSSYPHAITVYKLEEESASASLLVSITLSGNYPITFTEGDTFSHEGMTVTATYEDESTKDVTPSASFSGYDMATTGEQTVSVSYTEGDVTKTATYGITVTPIPTHTVTWNVNGSSTEESYKEGATITFPENPADIDDKVFMGWVTDEINGTTDEAPDFVTSATMGQSDITYYAVFAVSTSMGGEQTKSYGFETESDSDWTIDGPNRSKDRANSGSYSGKINTNHTYVTFNQKVNVKSFSFAFTRTSTNANYNVFIETSTDNFTWTAQETYPMNSFASDGTFTTITKTFDGNIAYYVRFHCSNTSAVRYVDDVTIVYDNESVTYSAYCTTVVADAREEAGISFAEATVTKAITENYSGQVLTNLNNVSPITWTSSNESVATIDNGIVTMEGIGETTITAAFAGDESYKAATVSYTLTVTDPTIATTLTINAEGITNTNVYTGTAAGLLSATVAMVDGAPVDNASVTWSSSNEQVATIDQQGVVTLVAAGTTTITASYAGVQYTYGASSATYELTVTYDDPNGPGSEQNPYTVAQALDNTPSNGKVYVKGVVSKFVMTGVYSDNYHRYYISDDGSTQSSQLMVFNGKGLNNEDFTSDDDVQIGDIVTIYGNLVLYNTTKEFGAGNYIVSLKRAPAAPTFSPEAGTYTSVQTVEISCATDGAVIYYTTDGTDPTSESTEYTAAIDVNASMTIKAIAVKDDLTSDVATAEYTIDFTPSIVFDGQQNPKNVPYETGSTNIHYVASNITGSTTLVLCDANGEETTYDWFSAELYGETYVRIAWQDNDGEARTAYFKLVADDTESPIFAVTQAEFVADYATLPFTFDGGKSAIDDDETNGLTQSGLGNDYNSSPKLKFDHTGDYLILKINERPGTLTFDIKGNSFSGSTFKVQTSEDGETYTDLANYTVLGETQNESFNNLGENVRYIKWIYTEKSSGNVALGNIALTKYEEQVIEPSITVAPTSVEAPVAGADGTLTVTYTDIDTDLVEIQWVEADGTTETTYGWVTAEFDNNKNIEYIIEANTGEARTAYLKIYGLDTTGNDVYSNLVTITQAAQSAPVTTVDWTLTDLADITEDDVFVIVGNNGDTYAMSNDKGTSAPDAVAVTIENKMLSEKPAAKLQWNLNGNGTDGYTFYPNGDDETWLYCTNANNGVKVGTGDAKHFTLSNGYLTTNETDKQRYLGIYNSQDWRCYDNTTGNINNQSFSFFKKSSLTLTLAASGYASYCSNKALDFSNKVKSYGAWYVSDVSGTTVTFTEITGAVPAGTPIILYSNGKKGQSINIPYATGETTAIEGNMLRGTLEPTEVTTEMVIDGQSYTLFGLSNGQFVKMKNGTVKANKAFLPILTSQVPTGSNARLDIVFSEETDGIKSIENGKLTIDNSVYDLQGRRVETMKKGSLYIVNGKKFVSK